MLGAEDLLQRILTERQPPVFIVGSGLALPLVPGTAQIELLIAHEYAQRTGSGTTFLADLPAHGNRYQMAFDMLLAHVGADSANAVIRRAVLNACTGTVDRDLLEAAESGDVEACERLVNDVSAWRLHAGLSAFGSLTLKLAAPNCFVVTTNFDPLIDVAVRAAGGQVAPMTFAGDGEAYAIRPAPGQIVVVHVHGDWYRADTLHTPTVLTRRRPRLQGWLRRLMQDRLVVVVGYAGWPDVVTAAIADMFEDTQARFDLRWAFFEKDEATIATRYPELLARLAPVLNERAFCHAGIDAQTFFPALSSAIDARPRAAAIRASAAAPSVTSARDSDTARLRRARELIVRWRDRYAARLPELRAAADQSEQWKSTPPQVLDDRVRATIDLAAEVANEFAALPVRDLEFTSDYGLQIHRTVFWGQAIEEARSARSMIEDPEAIEAMDAMNEWRRKNGEPIFTYLPDKYGSEMLSRLFESAEALARFDIGQISRGYIETTGKPMPRLLGPGPLLVVAVDAEPGLHAVEPGPAITRIGSMFARKLQVWPLCARRAESGGLDVLAYDDHHFYWWRGSSQLPSAEAAVDTLVVAAAFAPHDAGTSAVFVDRHGAVSMLERDGSCHLVQPGSRQQSLDKAVIWIDPYDAEAWHVISLTTSELASGPRGGISARRSCEDLTSTLPVLEGDEAFFSYQPKWLAIGTLQGLACLLVECRRRFSDATAVLFLDPQTLRSIRRPLLIPDFAGQLALAGGCWLVAALLQSGAGAGPRIAVWDLLKDDDAPLGKWLEAKADVYYPIVLSQGPGEFETVQVLRHFEGNTSEAYQLCRFHWPSGQTDLYDRTASFRIIPVEG